MSSITPHARLGLLSDTHGDVAATRAAITLLRNHGATMLLHLGDLDTEAVLEELVAFTGAVHLTIGNCDDPIAIGRHAERLGLTVHAPIGELQVDGRCLRFTHGHLVDLRRPPGDADCFLHGHTHRVRDERIGGMRVVNPGALFRADRRTVALYEPATDRLDFHELTDDPCVREIASHA